MKQPLVIGICGGSASGKTYLTDMLIKNSSPAKVTAFSLDSYYLPKDWQKTDALGYLNYDLPEALNTQKMIYDFIDLANGFSIEQPIYKYNISPPSIDFKIITPSPVIIVEGIFLFHYSEIQARLTTTVITDSPFELKRNRRIERDIRERGYTLEEIAYRFDNHAEESYKTHVLPFKKNADYVIETDADFNFVYSALLEQIQAY